MAATKLQSNWASVTFAGTGYTRITQMSFNVGGTLQSFNADTDHYPTVVVNLMNQPTASWTGADAAAYMAITPGATGTLTATHVDAAGASGGSIVYVLVNAVHENTQTSGSHAQFGSATCSFKSFSSDGITNPLSFSRA
jgi:hypothetical protein